MKLNTIEFESHRWIAYAASKLAIGTLYAAVIAVVAGILMLITGCATGPFQARKQAWARQNALTYGWQPVYVGNGETRYAPTALTRQVKSADEVAMKVATGQMRSISERELASTIDQDGAWWAKVADTSLASVLAGAAAYGVSQLTKDDGGESDSSQYDGSTKLNIRGDNNTTYIQGGSGNINSASRDNSAGEGGAVNHAPSINNGGAE